MSENKNHFDDLNLNDIEKELPEELEVVESTEDVVVDAIPEQLSLFDEKEEVEEQIPENNIPEAEEIDFLKEAQPFYPEEPQYEEPKQNKFLKVIGVSLLAACFGLVGGFIGSNLDLSSPADISIKNYKIDPVIVSQDMVDDLNNVSDIVENTMPSIVSITSTIKNDDYYYGFPFAPQETPSSGSGVIYSQAEDSVLVITNYHVIQNATTVTVGWMDGTTSPAIVQGYDANNDLALLKVNLTDIHKTTIEKLKIAVIGDSAQCKVGEGTIAIGNALGYGQTVTNGIVSALDRTVHFSDGASMIMLQTSAAINPGNSGGALLNGRGELIGINSAKYSDTAVEGIGYAIPVNTVIEVISNILEGRETPVISQGVLLGITAFDIDQQMAQNYKMPIGICIQFVEIGSTAEEFGLAPGDIITHLNDSPISSIAEFRYELYKHSPGESLKVTYIRNGKEKTTTVKLTENNQS
jgi:serine protease Do